MVRAFPAYLFSSSIVIGGLGIFGLVLRVRPEQRWEFSIPWCWKPPGAQGAVNSVNSLWRRRDDSYVESGETAELASSAAPPSLFRACARETWELPMTFLQAPAGTRHATSCLIGRGKAKKEGGFR